VDEAVTDAVLAALEASEFPKQQPRRETKSASELASIDRDLTDLGVAFGKGDIPMAAFTAAAKQLGAGVRVVSVPCIERFNRQSSDYRQSVLPASCEKRVAVEAGVSALWHQFVGPAGKIVAIDRFGLSAPAEQVFEALGITTEAVVAAARSL